MLCEGRLFLWRVEPIWVIEDVAGLIIAGLRHGGVPAVLSDRIFRGMRFHVPKRLAGNDLHVISGSAEAE